MKKRIVMWGLLLLAVTLLAGCAQQAETQVEPAEPEPAAEPAVFEMTGEMQAKLAAADLADGTEDGVVANCPGCNLAMAGKEEIAMPVGDYKVQFCSTHCKETFEKNVAESVLAMAVPEEEAVPAEGQP
jgi:hypothetical protein